MTTIGNPTEHPCSAASSADVWNLFVPFSVAHLITVLSCLTIVATIVLVGRTLRNKDCEQHARTGLAIVGVLIWIFYNVWWNWNEMDLYNGLPLHICDLAGLIAPMALLTRHRWLRAILYFWGFALSPLAFIQPTVTLGAGHLAFWMFWFVHTIVIGCAAYDLAAGGFRPTWSDFRRACIASACYFVIVLPINIILESNYGYIGNPQPVRKLPALLEALGPWPGRLAVIIVVTWLAFLMLLLPWLVVEHRRQTA